MGVVQRDVAGSVRVPLADLLKGVAQVASWWGAHEQRVLAVLRVVEVAHHSGLDPVQEHTG